MAKRLEDHVLGEVRQHFVGLEIEGVSGADLTAIDQQLAEAEIELERFATDLDARRQLGEAGWQQALAVRVTDRDRKRQRRDTAYAANRTAVLAQRLDDLDRHDLRDLLAGAVRHIFVRRMRGAPASGRTLIVWSDDSRVIDVPGPHRSGPFEPIRW